MVREKVKQGREDDTFIHPENVKYPGKYDNTLILFAKPG
jgi:hypothetical protein